MSDLDTEKLDGDLVPAPLFIDAERNMAGFRLEGAGVFYLLHLGYDYEDHPQFRYRWEGPHGELITEGTDFYAGAHSEIDYPAQFASWFSFIEADAEHYSHSLQMGTKDTCDEHDKHDMEYLAQCYQHSDEITMAHYDLTDEEDD